MWKNTKNYPKAMNSVTITKKRQATHKKIFLVIRDYCLNSSFHGLKFLAEKNRHWSERIYWIICIALSWYACGMLMNASYEAYKNDPISFGAETNYINWDTKFPTIAVCETKNEDRIADFTDNLYGEVHDYNLDEVIKELVWFTGSSYYTIQLCTGDTPHPDCPKGNFTHYVNEIMSKCNDVFSKCTWNNVEFRCCDYFLKIDTEIGACYAINTIQSRLTNSKKFPLISNRILGPGTLRIEITTRANVFMLNEEEVPTLSTLQMTYFEILPNEYIRRIIAIQEIENENAVREVAIENRKCRFVDENNLDVYKYYSYSACLVQCRRDAHFKTCNCTHHLMPNTDSSKQCNISGIECLNNHYNDLTVIKAPWSKRAGQVCNCLPSCTETELFVTKTEKFGSAENSVVEFVLGRLPTERYKRRVVRGRLDLVVSMGGTAALFVGASILSFIEVLYYLTIRLVKFKGKV